MIDGPSPGQDASQGTMVIDPIGLVLLAIGAGATAGAFVITMGVSFVRLLQRNSSAAQGEPTSFLVLTIGVMAGPIICATIVLWMTRPVNDLWRRSVAAAISVFVAFLLSGLSAPIDVIAGPLGLGIFAIVLATASVTLARRANTIVRH